MVIVYIGTGYIQVLYLGRAPHTKETLPDFHELHRVTRHPLVFCRLTGSQRTPGNWGVTIDVSVESTSQVYFPKWIYNHLDMGEELHIRLEEEGDAEIAKKLAIVGLACIQWYPFHHPSMKIVVHILEEGGNKLTIPPNPFASTIPIKTKLEQAKRSFSTRASNNFRSRVKVTANMLKYYECVINKKFIMQLFVSS